MKKYSIIIVFMVIFAFLCSCKPSQYPSSDTSETQKSTSETITNTTTEKNTANTVSASTTQAANLNNITNKVVNDTNGVKTIEVTTYYFVTDNWNNESPCQDSDPCKYQLHLSKEWETNLNGAMLDSLKMEYGYAYKLQPNQELFKNFKPVDMESGAEVESPLNITHKTISNYQAAFAIYKFKGSCWYQPCLISDGKQAIEIIFYSSSKFTSQDQAIIEDVIKSIKL